MGRTGLAPGDPERLGGYRLAGRLGAGGRGVVYEAYDEAGVRVAVKVFHAGVAAGSGARARFAGEVAAAQRVAPFCTARLIAAGTAGPEPYVVSEYVDGPSLREAVAAGGTLAGDRLVRLAVAIATALAAVHEAGVVHRDLEPGNVLLGPDGPRVTGFGVTRTKGTSAAFSVRLVGSPPYMAPEALTAAQVGPAADVFAWGAVVLFAATGRSPFEAGSVGAVLQRVLTCEPATDVLPEPLRSLAAAALDKDPEARPSSRDLLLGLLPPGRRGHALPGEDALAAALEEGARAAAGPVAAQLTASRTLGEIAEEVHLGLEAERAAPGAGRAGPGAAEAPRAVRRSRLLAAALAALAALVALAVVAAALLASRARHVAGGGRAAGTTAARDVPEAVVPRPPFRQVSANAVRCVCSG
ncbi:serine/threonine-protein kinase [Planomonospora corallina]|uniref:Serine/threonine-protein kinase n=1 Tax=Planomonospora corallina TaxID=1806052 RepID=A0ABV8I9W4_9ACTN